MASPLLAFISAPYPSTCATLAVIAVLAVAGSAGAVESAGEAPEDATATLRRIEQQLEAVEDRRRTLFDEAAIADQDLMDLRGRLIAAASDIMGQQDELRRLELELGALVDLEQALADRLSAGREATESLLAALHRLARRPAASLVAGRQAPLQTVRAAMLMRAAVPALEARAARLRAELSILADLRQALAARRSNVRAARGLLDGEIDQLTALVDERQALMERNVRDRAELADAGAALARQADDLRDLIRLLEEDGTGPASREAASVPPRSDAPAGGTSDIDLIAMDVPWSPGGGTPSATTRPMRPLPQFQGVVLPARGEVVISYDEPNPQGEVSKGLTLRTYPGAPLIAPLDGEVRFAGSFRGYGEILILQHRDGYHSLIAGVGRIDARVGQQVLIGEPIGTARLPQPDVSQPLTVYFELRRNGRPVDPIQGLAQAQMRGR